MKFWTVGFLLSLSAGVSAAAVPYPGNDSDSGVTRASGLVDPYTGNVSFSTHDMAVAGAVGPRGLIWGRCATSRTSSKEAFFGSGYNWAHNWQWEMVDAGNDSRGRAVLSVRLPGGWVHRFTQSSPGEWWPEPGTRFRLTSQGDAFIIQHLDGGEVRFTRAQAAQGTMYTLDKLVDAVGNVTTLTVTNGRLAQITEPAGRWLKITYAQLRAPDARPSVKPFTVITQVVASDGQTVAYNYEFPSGLDYPVLSSVLYPDTTSAKYTYEAPRQGARLLLSKAEDPRIERNARGRVFHYRSEAEAAVGQIAEVGVESGSAVLNTISADQRGLRTYAIKQDNGATVYHTYNPGGSVAEEIDALGFTTRHEYDVDGRGFKTALIDALGKSTRYERNANGQVVKQIAADGTVRSWQHDAKGRVLVETNELGHSQVYTRDNKGRVTKLQKPDGSVQETSYNDLGQPIARKAPTGAVTYFTIDSRGLRTAVVDPAGNSVTATYDEHDRIASTTDQRGNVTRFERDGAGRLVKTIYADGTSTAVSYDKFGQIIQQADASGVRKSHVFDTFGRRTSSFDASGGETRIEYAPLGTGPLKMPVSTTTPEGRTSTITYDANGRAVARTIAAGTRQAATTRYSYDARGRQTSVTNPRNQTIQFFYDELGRRVKTMNALNNATVYEYDLAGRKIRETDAKGNTTKWTYDAVGRQLTKTDAKGQINLQTHDAGGRIATITDSKGSTYRLVYDQVGRRTAMVYPDGSRETTTYDATSNKLSQTNRAGVSQHFTYDSRNREILSEWSDGSQRITKTYDAAGRMTSEDNGVSKLTFSFNATGRLSTETQDLSPVVTGGSSNPAPRTVSYNYTADGQRDSLTYPDKSFVTYTYNARGQLQDILGDDMPPPIASYEYDAAGNAIQMPRENDTETTLSYDAANRLTTIVETAQRRSPLSQLDYTYDEVDNRTSTTQRIDTDGNRRPETTLDTYQYDETYQVTGANYAAPLRLNGRPAGEPEHVERFTYDTVGNRITVNQDGKVTRYSVNNLNEYTQVGAFAPAYDRNGNLAAVKEWLYRYDSLNRLVEATNGRMTAKFYYDARNRCVSRGYNGATTLNYFDNWNLIEERDVQGNQIARYVHGREVDEIVAMVNQRGTFYPHRDVLGNVTMVTGADGKLVERYSYTVTGVATIFDARGNELSASSIGNRWLYTGREWLKEIGLYDSRNRIYSAELARFMQTDPIRFRGNDINIYRYVGNGYVRYTDPTGLDWFGPPPGYEGVHVIGRGGSIVPEGGAVGVFIEDYVPAGWTFGRMHDSLVTSLRADGVPDFIANIPTMVPTYAAAVAYEMWDFTTDVLDVGLNFAVDVIEFTFDLVGGVLDAIGDALSSAWDWLFGE